MTVERGFNNQKPGLLVLASTYPRWQGDPEPGFVHELSKRLVTEFQVTVLCPHAPGAAASEVMDGVNVVRYRYAPARLETLVNDGGIIANLKQHRWKALLLPGFFLAQLWAAWRLLRTRDIDLVHAHWLLPQGWVAALLQCLPGKRVPYIVTSHGADLYALRGRVSEMIKRHVVTRAAHTTVVSNAMCAELARLGLAADRIAVAPMGVDLSGMFYPDADIPRDRGEILFVGRLVEKKGLRFLLEAMPLILRECPAARLTVAGFGPEERTLREQTERLGLREKVHFVGAVSQADLPGLYRRAGAFVAPFVQAADGDREGLGLVTVEALGCGCTTVVGNVSAVGELTRRGALVDEVDARDPPALAAAVVSALKAPRPSEAVAASVQWFDWSKRAEAYRSLLQSAWASPASTRGTGAA